MLTDLFAAVSGFAAPILDEAVPPACRRAPIDLPAPRSEGPDVLFDLAWRPTRPARHFVPALAVLRDSADFAYRFELAVEQAGTWSAWAAAAPLGDAAFEALPARVPGLAGEIDQFVAERPADRVRVRLRVRARDPGQLVHAPWLVSLSASDLAPVVHDAPRAPAGVALDVPALSQMEEPRALQRRVCSPVSLAMVLAFWRVAVDVATVARELYHPALDLYGVWPAAIRAAARRGLAGYLLRFPDWASAEWCLARGIPIIASVRYAAGELEGAAIGATAGHLLVLTGWDGDDVLVNDPAAADRASVPRRYRRSQLTRVWLERAGVGYVVWRPMFTGA